MKIILNRDIGNFSIPVNMFVQLIKANSCVVLSENVLEAYGENYELFFPHWSEAYQCFSSDYFENPAYQLLRGDTYYSLSNTIEARSNHQLIQLCESVPELLVENGGHLSIVNVPDDVDIEISRNDLGYEWVAEKHRTWY